MKDAVDEDAKGVCQIRVSLQGKVATSLWNKWILYIEFTPRKQNIVTT